jgi:hypothetical protein
VQPLQHHGAAVGEQPQHRVGRHLVADLGPRAAGGGEALRVDDGAVLGDAQERGAQSAPRQQLVDRGQVEQVGEVVAGVRRAGQQRPA